MLVIFDRFAPNLSHPDNPMRLFGFCFIINILFIYGSMLMCHIEIPLMLYHIYLHLMIPNIYLVDGKNPSHRPYLHHHQIYLVDGKNTSHLQLHRQQIKRPPIIQINTKLMILWLIYQK